MSNIYTKEQLIKRGWNDEKIEVLLHKPYHETPEKIGWNRKQIRKIEKYDEYINFTGGEAYAERKDLIIARQKELTSQAIIDLKSIKPTTENHKCLISHVDDYRDENGVLPNELVHFPLGCEFEKDDSFKMFTDGCLKVVGTDTFVSCGGWIKNSNNEIVMEFAKEFDATLMNSAYDFEIFGISTGMNIVKELGLTKIKCYTDSSGEAKILSLAIGGFTQERMLDLPEIYLPLIEILKKLNAEIAFIPREYNEHADELTKIHMMAHREKEKKMLEEQKNQALKRGFDYDLSERTLYFIHPKIEVNTKFEEMQEKTQWILYGKYYKAAKKYYNFLINTQSEEFHVISKINKKTLGKFYGDEVSNKQKEHRLSNTDTAGLLNLSLCLDSLNDLKNISIANISAGFKVTLENIVPIREKFKPEYFEFHKKLNNFDKVFSGEIPINLQKKIDLFVNTSIFDANNEIKKTSPKQ